MQGGYYPPSAGSLPGRRRCEASRRRFRRRRRCETERSDLGWRFSFFSHSFFCKKKKEWEKEKTYSLRWISIFPIGRGRCAGPSIFLVLGKKDTGEKEPLMKSEGFLGSVSAHYRSRPLALALRGLSSDTLDEAKRLTEAACSFYCHSSPVHTPVRNLVFRGKIPHQSADWIRDDRIPHRCAHRFGMTEK